MTEQTNSANAPAPQFNLQRVYMKDLSLEIPDAPNVFLDNAEPRLEFQIDAQDKEIGPNVHEVTVRCTVTCRLGEKVGFLVEASQAGIFEIRHLPADQMGQVLGMACPQIIYPYLRGNVADVVQRAGFPPVHLAEINFQMLYQQQLEQQQAQAATQTA